MIEVGFLNEEGVGTDYEANESSSLEGAFLWTFCPLIMDISSILMDVLFIDYGRFVHFHLYLLENKRESNKKEA